MGQIKVTPGTWFAPFFGWTRADYERALQRDVVAPAPVVASTPRGPVAAFVEAVGTRPAWQADALCREYRDVDWFADQHAAAKSICERCLCRAECRTAGEQEHGVWGATNSRERARLRRAKVA